MKYFLSFDVGTTSMKCLLFDERFNEVFFDEREYTLETPQEDMVELDANIYYDVLCECIKKLAKTGIDTKSIKTITFTTQGETLIPIDKNGEPLRKAIVWIDQRAEKEAEFIKSQLSDDEIYRTTGLGEINGAVPMAKLMWIHKNEREIYDKTYKFMLLEDYLIYKLTQKAVTEQSIVSSTAWFDIINEKYYQKMLDICGIDINKLPDISDCGKIVDKVTLKAAVETGLSIDTVVVTGAMDQVSSAIGAGNINEGIVTETTGTALVVGVTADKPDFDNASRITIYKHFNHKYLYMPYCNTAGIVLKWFRDCFMVHLKKEAKEKGVSVYSLIDKLAESSKAGSNGIVVLPHFAGKADNQNAKGAIYGLTLGTKLCDISRGVLEAIGCMLYELLHDIEKTGVEISEIRALGGGATSDIWCSIKAGITQKTILRTTYVQTTALGAAILGSVAVGEYSSVEEALKTVDVKYTEFKPIKEEISSYKKLYEKYSELYEVLDKIF